MVYKHTESALQIRLSAITRLIIQFPLEEDSRGLQKLLLSELQSVVLLDDLQQQGTLLVMVKHFCNIYGSKNAEWLSLVYWDCLVYPAIRASYGVRYPL